MSIVERELALFRHPRLAPLATSAWPAWLWSADGSQIAVGQRRRRRDIRQRDGRNRHATPPWRRRCPGRPNCPSCSDPVDSRPRAAGATARFWRGFRPRAHLRLLAHRALRRQRRCFDRCGRAGGTGTAPRRARPPLVRRLCGADRGLCAGRHADLRQRCGAGAARGRDHTVGDRHRNARCNGPRNRQRQRYRAQRPNGLRRYSNTPRQRPVARLAGHHVAAAEQNSRRAERAARTGAGCSTGRNGHRRCGGGHGPPIQSDQPA